MRRLFCCTLLMSGLRWPGTRIRPGNEPGSQAPAGSRKKKIIRNATLRVQGPIQTPSPPKLKTTGEKHQPPTIRYRRALNGCAPGNARRCARYCTYMAVTAIEQAVGAGRGDFVLVSCFFSFLRSSARSLSHEGGGSILV
ncbi:hypothetical protein B0J13DRAFT_563891, partial [Dactylonectria estremocensis]